MLDSKEQQEEYRGRLAPSPTGYLHLGHAQTFRVARERALTARGVLVLRVEDLDRERCRREYLEALYEDLRWAGLLWTEGPDCGGVYGPYLQSQRMSLYAESLQRLAGLGLVYPCRCSRQDVLRSIRAPHAGEEELIYPGTCRPPQPEPMAPGEVERLHATRCHWRFRAEPGVEVAFRDGFYGEQTRVAGRDFGDFMVWRGDGVPSYQLAVVVDDALMRITEVVRGADLLTSTARQILLYRALGWAVPKFFHCPLMLDDQGVRLAKRHDALSLRKLRNAGLEAEQLQARVTFTSG